MADPMTWLSSTQALLLAIGIGAGLVFGYFMFPTMRQAKRRIIELEQARQDADLVRQELDHTTQELSQARVELEQAREDLDQARAELDAARREHDRYKGSVSDHFVKTADLVGEMTRSYAAVYDHLAGGAQLFCGDAVAGKAVVFGPSPAALASPAQTTSVDPEAEAIDESQAEDTDFAMEEAAPELDADEASLDSPSGTTTEDADDFPAADLASDFREPDETSDLTDTDDEPSDRN
jgi:uncharacterized membrane-anchored protein YhcB (DUF1043 family)